MSDTPDHTSDLPRTKAASENPVARLSALWRHGQKPDLQEFLAGAGQLSAAELTDVLCTDQHERWMDGSALRSKPILSSTAPSTPGRHSRSS